MSRVGKEPIQLPSGVEVKVHDDRLQIAGPKGELTTPVPSGIRFSVADGILQAERVGRGKKTRALWGLARSLAANAVIGVTEGYRRELRIEGIGYRANMQGRTLNMQLGFSHPVEFPVPEGIDINVEDQTKITVEGVDKQQVGEVAAQIRRIRPPEPYKGKGIRYADEIVRKKVGKAAVTTM